MILFGGKLSPFVRRVALWLRLQDRAFEPRIVAVLAEDFGGMRSVNPVGRVPVLELESGESLIETFAIIDYLEDSAATGKRLIPPTGIERRDCVQRLAYANSVAEKGVALVYETKRRPAEFHWPAWQQRLAVQIRGGLDSLEAMAPETGWIGGETPNGADIGMVCAYDFITVMHPHLADGLPRLRALSERANALPAFKETYPVAS